MPEVRIGDVWETVLGIAMVVTHPSFSNGSSFVCLRGLYNPNRRLENVSPISNPGVFKELLARNTEWNQDTLHSLHYTIKGDKREKCKTSNPRRLG
jgi:hypothetical protein